MLDRSGLLMKQLATFPLLDTSMTQLDTWSRCDRRYYYRFVQGLVPIGSTDALEWGNLWHLALQTYYRGIQQGLTEASAMSNAHWVIANTKVVENKTYGDTKITLDEKSIESMHDVLDYYYQETMSKDDWDEIVKVEDPIYLVIGYQGNPVLRIRSTIDLLARKNKRLVLVDHKSTGDVEQNVTFLGLDFQVHEYPLSVRAYYEEDPIFCYNMMARDVPPGFGHRPLTTETGRKRDPETLRSMQNPAKYLRREWITYNEQQYNAFQITLVQTALAIQFEGNSGIWPRRVVKMGGMSCDRCPYFEPCKAELDGRRLQDMNALITMAFTRDEKILNPKPQITIATNGNPFLS